MSPRLHTPTPFDAHISDLITGFAIPSIVLTMLILGAYAWTAWNPVSRPHLNRVSFRLLVYALVAYLAYGVGVISGMNLKAGAACNGIVFLQNICLMFSGVMFSSMALNLQLVLVHGVNGQKMEKYYVLGAVLLTLACNIPPYAAGAFGFWEVNQTCWFNSSTSTVQLRWFVGTQAFWLILMATCEVVSFFSIVGFMIFRHRVRSVMSKSTLSTLSQPPLPKPPILLYRKMILRIGLYPLVSCFFNISGAMLDLHIILDPTWTETNWRLSIVDLLIYVLRPLVYATLAATDLSFLRALHALRPPSEQQSDLANPTRMHVTLNDNTWFSSATTSMYTEPSLQAKEEGSATVSEGSLLEFTCQI